MGSAGGGGIGVEFSLANLPKMLPGLILCAIFGWMALQWDATMSKWNNHFKEAEKVLKAVNEGLYNFVDNTRVYGEKAARMKESTRLLARLLAKMPMAI